MSGSGRFATFEVDFQEREHSNLIQGEELQGVILSIQAGPVTLVPALTDAALAEVPPAEIPYNAPTLVSRERSTGAAGFPTYDARHSITLRIPVPFSGGCITLQSRKWFWTPGYRPQQWSSKSL